jgi:hypothetical protein
MDIMSSSANPLFILDKLAQRISEAADRSADFDHAQLGAPSETSHPQTSQPTPSTEGDSDAETKLASPLFEEVLHLPHAPQLPVVPGLAPIDLQASCFGQVSVQVEKVETMLRQLRCKLVSARQKRTDSKV